MFSLTQCGHLAETERETNRGPGRPQRCRERLHYSDSDNEIAARLLRRA